jgi:hypothetical protein
MTRKDYVALAKIVGAIKNQGDRTKTIMRVCAWCKAENPRFNAGIFRKAVELYKELDLNPYSETT